MSLLARESHDGPMIIENKNSKSSIENVTLGQITTKFQLAMSQPNLNTVARGVICLEFIIHIRS